MKVLVEGTQRAKVALYDNSNAFCEAEVASFIDEHPDQREADVLMRTLLSQFEQYVKLNKKYHQKLLLLYRALKTLRAWRIPLLRI